MRMFPAFEYRTRHEAHERFLPRWMHRAACAGMNGGPETTWDAAFHDEVSMKADLDDYSWPEDVRTVMQLCARCPVRSECLNYAFETTKRMELGDPVFYVTHTGECNERWYREKDQKRKPPPCDGCIPRDKRLRNQPEGFSVEPMHMGVFGGCPGRIREHFSRYPDAIRRCAAWFREEALKMGWTVENEEERTA